MVNKDIFTQEDIRNLQRGDNEAFKKLFFAYQPRIYRFLWLKLRSVELAEDLVQDTFYRIWQVRERLQPDGNLESYLFRIAGNLAIDSLRKQKRKEADTELDDEKISSSRSAEGEAEFNQTAQIIDSIVNKLPDRTRTAFLLSRYEGLSYAEIGEVMEISMGTVEKHIGNALRILRKQLEKSDVIPKS